MVERSGELSVFQEKEEVGMYVGMYKEVLLVMEKKRCMFVIIWVGDGRVLMGLLSMGVGEGVLDDYFYIKISYLLVGK